MFRTTGVVLAGLVLALAGPARAADEAPAGNWKFSFLAQDRGQMATPWIIRLEKKGDQWAGTVLASAEEAPPKLTVDNVSVTPDVVRFDLRFQGQTLSFEGRLPPAKNKQVLGNFLLGQQLVPAQLEATQLKSFDLYDVLKEMVASSEAGPELFSSALMLLGQAAQKKAAAEEVRAWANKAFTAAGAYGSRWQQEMALRIANALLPQDGLAPLGLEYARKAQRFEESNQGWRHQLRIYDTLAEALRKTDKPDEAKEFQTKSDQLYAKNMITFKPEKYAGRKKSSERRVLVELFTGAQCPPCVAADLAFDALDQTYSPADVVLLEYHLHIPRPDPLANEDTDARNKFYGDDVEGTPTLLFNGKLKPRTGGGGNAEGAKEKYQAYGEAINPLLEQTTSIKLTARAVRKGDKIDISTEAAGLETTGDKIRLRLVLVEDLVRYPGTNSIRLHHHVVRAMPGGAEGMPLKDKTGKQEITVDLKHVRESLTKHLDAVGKQAQFPDSRRPMELGQLRVVAFVQNDETKEVLQAVEVPVTGGTGVGFP